MNSLRRKDVKEWTSVTVRAWRWVGALTLAFVPSAVSAQITPAAPITPPDDTPSIRLGATIYADYTYQSHPDATDADGNTFHPNAFNVTRSYINVTGNISHMLAFRITPDITRADSEAGNLNGSLVFRVKYAFMQFNLDDWISQGSWTRLGIQQTPWVDFEENIYRYRFQGQVFSEREGYLSSSDAGASFRYNMPSNYGDVHVGFYNGENYNRVEVNDQKAFQVRATVRPLPTQSPVWRGLRAHVFYDADAYVKNAERRRFVASATYEHSYVNAGFDYLDTKDQTSGLPGTAEVEGRGYSIWVNPKQAPTGWEVLLRYDHLRPNRAIDGQERKRTIAGVAYWFPHQGSVATALLLDYDGVSARGFIPSVASQDRIAVHGQVIF